MFSRRERMMSKRKKTLKASKSTDDSITSPTPVSSTLSHIRRKIDDSISELSQDVALDHVTVTSSPSLEPDISIDCDPSATRETIESGICASPRSLCEDEQNELFQTEPCIEYTKPTVKRTESDILNQNHEHPYTDPEYHDKYAADTYPHSYHSIDT